MFKIFCLGLLISTQVVAARDSVAFFYSAKKVNVLLNERGFNTRIHQFLEAIGADQGVHLVSEDNDIRLGCATEDNRATCTFTFYPSSSVKIVDKKLFVNKDVSSLGIEPYTEFEMSFQGSMKDQIQLRISNGVLTIFASK